MSLQSYEIFIYEGSQRLSGIQLVLTRYIVKVSIVHSTKAGHRTTRWYRAYSSWFLVTPSIIHDSYYWQVS
jgi:hypothetical protein